ncbi:MAG: ABC transporter permease subunit [Pseudomonadota bacterium]|jgi:ABC-2 type transport system permease protein|nr:ABC transporter permease subunit [Pseudomonadota bacterium]
MNGTLTIMRRELRSYFSTPLAYVFIVIFLVLSSWFTFNFGNFYNGGQANLAPFFGYHPWLYLFLIPALSMRLWAEEHKTGTIELLLTLPLELWESVAGKFLAAWAFTALAVVLTFPIWITVNYLGAPDNGVIMAAYLGSLMMAGGFLAIGSFISATTNNQVIAFILAVVICFAFLLAGFQPLLSPLVGWVPQTIIDAIASLSFLTHFSNISKGVIDLRNIIYFALLIGTFLYANVLVLHMKKTG